MHYEFNKCFQAYCSQGSMQFVVICEIFILLGAKCEILPAAGRVTLMFTYSAKDCNFSVKQTRNTAAQADAPPGISPCASVVSHCPHSSCVYAGGGWTTHYTDYFVSILLSGNYLGKVSLGDFIASAKCN